MADRSHVRAYRAWAPEEEQALRSGVKVHGVGAWQAIRSDPRFSILEGRRNIQLKDKWRNLLQFSHVSVSEEDMVQKTGKAVDDRQPANNHSSEDTAINRGDARGLITMSSWESEQISADIAQRGCGGLEARQSDNGSEPYGRLHSHPATSHATEDSDSARESDCAETSGLHGTVSALLQPPGIQPSCGLAEFTLRSLHGLADAVINQQKEHAQQNRSQQHRVSESSEYSKLEEGPALEYDHEMLTALELALEAHDVQQEANRQLEIIVEASANGLPGMQAWMGNAVNVAKLANEKAAYAWWRLEALKPQNSLMTAKMEESIPEDFPDQGGDDRLAAFANSLEDDEDEAAEALSFLQSGVLLHANTPLRNSETNDDQPLDFTQCQAELQRWAECVRSLARRRWKRRPATTHSRPQTKKAKHTRA